MLNNSRCIKMVIFGIVRNYFFLWENYLRVWNYGKGFVWGKRGYWKGVCVCEWKVNYFLSILR